LKRKVERGCCEREKRMWWYLWIGLGRKVSGRLRNRVMWGCGDK